MRAMVITEPGGPEVLQIQDVADPAPGAGDVLIRVKAFGINHAETHMRKGEWPEATPISGIEAVALDCVPLRRAIPREDVLVT